jgi:hypothetical protein
VFEQAVQREPARVPEDHARRLLLEVQQIETLGELAVIIVVEHGGRSWVRPSETERRHRRPGPRGGSSVLGARGCYACARTTIDPRLRVVVVVMVAQRRDIVGGSLGRVVGACKPQVTRTLD